METTMDLTHQNMARIALGETVSGDPGRAFVSVRDLVKHYPLPGWGRARSIKSVDGVSFAIREGEVLGLVGESGCGKSTIARLLMRLTPPTRGLASVDGVDIFKLEGEALRRWRPAAQLVFQDPFAALDPRMRIGTSLEAPLVQHGIGDRDSRRARVLQMLGEVGLDASFYERYPRQCSGGQLQRIVIARALLLQPRFLVCDEPTSALDASMRTQVLNLLMDLKRRFSLTLLMISHDLRVVRYMCDRIAVMYLGQIVEIATRDELFEHPRHPYTRALIASSLLEETGLGRMDTIVKGEPPSPLNPPSGCRFNPRCPYAEDRCRREMPALDAAGDGLVRCHLWDRIGPFSAAVSKGRPAVVRAPSTGRGGGLSVARNPAPRRIA
jgi:oligopeptide/dipeptide ABC transporter ATP-binding protein